MTATLPPHADVRDCRLYRFRVWHPDDMHLPAEQRRVVLGYVGETVRQPLVRLLEHLYDQPWADTIVGWDVDPRVFAGKHAVLQAERAAIEKERPLYNVIHNEGPHRIPPPLAMRQRRIRDRVKPVEVRWVHPDDRGGPPRAPSRPAAPRPPAGKSWRPWQKHTLGVGVAWTALTPRVWCWLGCPTTEKQWKRRWRKARRRLR